MKKLRVLLAFMAFTLLVSVVYAVAVWSATASVRVVSAVGTIKVYWDAACTDPVTTIDFGTIQQGGIAGKRLWIKNEGGGTVGISYTSTISTETGGKITDSWFSSIYLSPGTVADTVYAITVALDCPVQSYSWTITIEVG